MSNFGKFIDRNPTIKAAGVPNQMPDQSAEKCLNYILIEEKIDAIRASMPKDDSKIKPRRDPINKEKLNRYYTEVRALTNPGHKTFYQSLMDDFKQTKAKAYWNSSVGQVRDPIPGLPAGYDYKNRINGVTHWDNLTAGDILNPKLTTGQVALIDEIGRELYKKSHLNYQPGERKYADKNLNLDLVHGVTKHDPEDGGLENCLQWFNQRLFTATSKNISSFKIRHQHQLGKVLAPNNNESKVASGHRYGITTRGDGIGAREALLSMGRQSEQSHLMASLGAVNAVRYAISKMSPPFPYLDFYNDITSIDNENSGSIPIDEMSIICKEYGLKIDFNKIKLVLTQTGALNDSKINYDVFCNIIMPQLIFPNLNRMPDIPPENLHYESCYQSTNKDLDKKEDDIKAAGLSSSELYTIKSGPFMVARSDRCNLGTETNAASCIYPHLFMQYNLSHRDFFRPRTKEFIKNLFEKVGAELSDKVFEELWCEGLRRDNTGYVCVETFRNMLEEVVEARFTQEFRVN